MKKAKLLVRSLIVGCVAIAGVLIYQSYATSSSLIGQNIEALSAGEGGSPTWTCWSEIGPGGGQIWMCGNPCEKTLGSSKGGRSTCR